MCHPFPVLHCHPNPCSSPCLLSQPTTPSTFLHPSPGFSIAHSSFSVAFICTTSLSTSNAAPGCNLKQLSEEQQPARPPSLLLIKSQIPPKPKRGGGQGKGTGVAVGTCPPKCQDSGRRRVFVPMVPPGKPGRWQEEARNAWGNGGSLRAALVTWSSPPLPGLKRILGGWPQSPTRSWCNTLR